MSIRKYSASAWDKLHRQLAHDVQASLGVTFFALYFFQLHGGLVEWHGDEVVLTEPPRRVSGSFTIGTPWRRNVDELTVSDLVVSEAKEFGDLQRHIERTKRR